MANEAVGYHETLPHVEWVDLDRNGVAIEVIVLKRDKVTDDLYYIRTETLDEIDLRRMTQILSGRDAGRYDLWDLLDNTTLANGENALEFYHQLVEVVTASGQKLKPSAGRAGIALQPVAPKRGPGRPRKDEQ